MDRSYFSSLLLSCKARDIIRRFMVTPEWLQQCTIKKQKEKKKRKVRKSNKKKEAAVVQKKLKLKFASHTHPAIQEVVEEDLVLIQVQRVDLGRV